MGGWVGGWVGGRDSFFLTSLARLTAEGGPVMVTEQGWSCGMFWLIWMTAWFVGEVGGWVGGWVGGMSG